MRKALFLLLAFAASAAAQHREDAAHVSGHYGEMCLAVRQDAAAALCGTDGDYCPPIVDASGRLWVNPSGVTQPISAASLPLPAGAATAAKQDTGNTSLATIAGAVSGTEMQVDVLTMPTTTVQATNLDIRDLTATDVVTVTDGAGALNTIVDSGSITANAGTNLNTSALVLETTITSRLPASVALAEDAPNPTLSRLATFGFVFDGTTWDRMLGNSTDGTLVNLGANNDVTVTGTVTANAGSGTFVVGDGSGALNVIVDSGTTAVTATNLDVQIGGSDSLTIGTFPDNEPVNLGQVGGTSTVNGGLAGSLSVGGTAASNAVINQNPLLIGVEALSTQPVAATTGNQRRLVGSLDGAAYVRFGGPVPWECSLDAIGTTLTECEPAPGAGLRLYLTDLIVASTTATAGQFLVRYGTGTNCGTGTVSLFPSAATVVRFPYAANTSVAGTIGVSLATPLAPPAANAICIVCIATNTCTVQMSGYIAP